MPEIDREDRVAQLRRLVESGEYQVDPREVAASIIRESEKPEHVRRTPICKTANTAD